jgi:hypothetical protein
MADIEVRFSRARGDKTAICVQDGSEEPSPLTGRPRPREFWLPVKLISGVDPKDVDSFNPRQKLNLVIPQWLAEKVGLV